MTGQLEKATVTRQGLPWAVWPVYWSAVWVGALAVLAIAVVIGLVGVAIGAHEVGSAARILKWSNVRIATVIFSVFGAFLAFVGGGWVTGKIAGIGHSETAMLHGAITWLVALALLLLFLTFGGSASLGGWYGGLAGSPAWVAASAAATDPNAAVIARNSALGAITALLLGLIGSVIGGWLASGEPMTFTIYRTRSVMAGRVP